jgi:hypothetical protein
MRGGRRGRVDATTLSVEEVVDWMLATVRAADLR